MKLTPNLKLKKPDLTDNIIIGDFNANADILETEISALIEAKMTLAQKNKIDNLAAVATSGKFEDLIGKPSNMKTGASTFAGNGQEVQIAHNLGQKPEAVYVSPTANPGGFLGEVWVRFNATHIFIGNSGSFEGGLCWTAIL